LGETQYIPVYELLQYNFWKDHTIQQKARASAVIASSGNGQENGYA
jgi:hypothetical protein